MKENLQQQIKQAPLTSGVYQFLDDNDKVLYVGKAKNLRKRLTSYMDKNKLNTRLRRMTSLAQKITIITTNTEVEALLLECNLIKKLMPRYNILLRDDKSFPYILITKQEFPRLAKHRGKKNIVGNYFGPFANNYAVDETIDVLKKSFLIRSCSDSEFKSRHKPCLQYQIKRCAAPCVGLVGSGDYDNLITEALDFLSGKKSELQADLSKKMQEFSQNLDFEKARILRDRIQALSVIQAKQNIHLSNDENIDFIALAKQNNYACIVVSFFRNGNNYGFKPYFLNVEIDDSEDEIISAFLEQFYNEQGRPDLVVLSHAPTSFESIKTIVPKVGSKFNLLQDYLKLANTELQKKLNSQIKDQEILVELKRIFSLPKIPETIEVYDNSHTSGQYVVGAMIMAGPDGFIKSGYRKFNINLSELETKDDSSFLRQVLIRRFGKSETKRPDLIIIDGGKPQLSAAHQAFAELEIVDQKYVAMSKGENRNAGEEFFHQVGQDSFTLEKSSPIMHYLQRLRDEAHRFAIGFSRQKRAKSVTKSELDEIKDVGSKRKMLLLNHFGSVSAIKQAGVEDLMRVKGISKNIAEKIANYFNG